MTRQYPGDGPRSAPEADRRPVTLNTRLGPRLPAEAEAEVARFGDSPAVFVGQRGRMTPDGIRDVVARYAGVSPHRLRHSFAYEYLDLEVRCR